MHQQHVEHEQQQQLRLPHIQPRKQTPSQDDLVLGEAQQQPQPQPQQQQQQQQFPMQGSQQGEEVRQVRIVTCVLFLLSYRAF